MLVHSSWKLNSSIFDHLLYGVRPLDCMSVRLSVRQSVSLPPCLSVCLLCLSVYLFNCNCFTFLTYSQELRSQDQDKYCNLYQYTYSQHNHRLKGNTKFDIKSLLKRPNYFQVFMKKDIVWITRQWKHEEKNAFERFLNMHIMKKNTILIAFIWYTYICCSDRLFRDFDKI